MGLNLALEGAVLTTNTTNSSYRNIVWPFAVAETILWAASYYAFPAFLLEWERDLGWSKTALVSAFTTALVLSAVSAPFVGRFIDRGHAKLVFSTSVLSTILLLIVLSQVRQFWQFFVVWASLGLAMSGMLYEACFTVLTRSLGNSAKQAITIVTLIAGFAGTVSFPAAHYLSAAFGWREAVLIFAAAVTIIALPLVWIGCRHAENHYSLLNVENSISSSAVHAALGAPAFWFLALAFTTLAISHGAIIPHLLSILREYQIDPNTAVFAAAMIGPMQVTGRLAMMASERHISIFATGIACFLAMSVASLALLYSGKIAGLLILFVILQGASNGVATIVRPVIVANLLGRASYGTIAGMIAVPFLLGFAIGPTAAAMVWTRGGYDLVLTLTFSVTLIGLLALLAARKLSG